MKAVIDRIEDGIAVLILCEDHGTIIQLPDFLLSDGKEGDLVDLVITWDESGTKASREKSRELIDNLGK